MLKTLLIVGNVSAKQYELVWDKMDQENFVAVTTFLDVRTLQAEVMEWLSNGHIDESWVEPYLIKCGPTYGIIFENDDRRIEFELLTHEIADNNNEDLKVFVIQRDGQLKEIFGATTP